ncbi:hypothetical protein ACFFSH_31735 [Streptomyces filamentosus]|uniref:Uncharacterized protein n=1 Tax=Streptomyces filamentosus TaxID=67294 RepID=A0A919BV64_STRFL|nr:hypothetical protein [Streptomyces filamentosus]GHG13479.1 hypothetical protein GCM10017667_54210 [Streptomyces filamentosus]
MQVRLLTAVRALLTDPKLIGRKDVVRLGILVLMAKASHGRCRVEITARELGRWLGVSKSTVDHEVLSVLREVDAVASRVLRGSDGLPTGVEYRVEPLWEVRGDVGAPLALSKVELATLLRFVEGLFAPGWGERCATPPGLLVEHRGRGAASDRLALVLLALHARPDGRVPLVGGPLAKSVARYGRAAVTLARMLGCSVPVAAAVLERLRASGVVTGAASELRLPAVAAAHSSAAAVQDAADLASSASPGLVTADDAAGYAQCACHEGVGDELVVEGDGWRQMSWDDLETAEESSGTAPRDLDDVEIDLFAGQSVFETFEASRVAADSHTDHAVVADVCGEGAGGLGFSGEAASGYCRQPVRTCEDGNSPASEPDLQGDVSVVGGEDGPLRGENPDLLLAERESEASAAVWTLQAWRAVSGGPPPVWAQVPKGLERVLEPVAMVWGRLDRLTTRRYVTKVVRAQLYEISGACGPEVDAERILRERFKRRLAEQGTVPINDPVGWLVGRALPRRSVCPDRRCDDGRRMDTRADCTACQMLVLDGRALRARAFTKATTALTGGRVDRSAFEAELNACWHQEAAFAAVRHEQALQERKARERVWVEQRDRYVVQEAARQALACEVCGKPESAGMCGRCRDERRVEELVTEAVDVAVATWGMSGEARQLEVVRRTEGEMRGAVDQAVGDLLAAGGSVFPESVALAARLAAELQLAALRRRAVNKFAYQAPVQAEYEKVFATEMRRSHLHGSLDEAREVAEETAQRVRFNTAQTLLDARLRMLRSARLAEVDAEPDWHAQAAAQVRALIRPAPRERAVSVRRPSSAATPVIGGELAGVGA